MDLSGVDLFVLDMDGTVYIGNEVFPWTVPFLRKIKTLGKDYVFLTNNSSKGPKDYVEKLRKLGIPVEDDGVYTSGEAAASFVKEKFGHVKVHVFGTDELKGVFSGEGLEVVEEDPDVLVLGYDTTVTYEKIARFALFLRRDVPYVATHPDLNCPSPDGLIPDAGSFIALFEASTGRRPEHVVGKPNPDILLKLLEKRSITPDKVAVIGDRLYTDMELAKRVGAVSVLVLSGETTREDLEKSELKPDLVVENLSKIPL